METKTTVTLTETLKEAMKRLATPEDVKRVEERMSRVETAMRESKTEMKELPKSQMTSMKWYVARALSILGMVLALQALATKLIALGLPDPSYPPPSALASGS